MALPPDIEKGALPGGNTNSPASGTYGEKADLNRLRQSLPTSGMTPPGAPVGPGPMPSPTSKVPGVMGRPPAGPPGVPPAILGPTTSEVPVSTPLASAGASGLVSTSGGVQARMALLDQLAGSTEVSAATREWARLVREMLEDVV